MATRRQKRDTEDQARPVASGCGDRARSTRGPGQDQLPPRPSSSGPRSPPDRTPGRGRLPDVCHSSRSPGCVRKQLLPDPQSPGRWLAAGRPAQSGEQMCRYDRRVYSGKRGSPERGAATQPGGPNRSICSPRGARRLQGFGSRVCQVPAADRGSAVPPSLPGSSGCAAIGREGPFTAHCRRRSRHHRGSP